MSKFSYALWFIRPQIGKLQILHDMNAVCGCKIWSLPILGRVLYLLWRAGHFLPQIPHTRSPTAPIWNIIRDRRLLIAL
jgi:hypothetical protein